MTLKALLYIIATTNGTTEEEIKGRFKGGKMPFIRMYFYYQAYVEYQFKCCPIAKLIGRDHTAVLWGAKKFSELLSINDPDLLEVINNSQYYLTDEESNTKAKVRRA